jgi:signal transduction histidine kinase
VDTGSGIDSAFLPHIFDMFHQAPASNAVRQQRGLGLGLSIVRRLVELHGGTVAAHSAGAGRGATFTVRLPLSKAEAGEPATVKAERSAAV